MVAGASQLCAGMCDRAVSGLQQQWLQTKACAAATAGPGPTGIGAACVHGRPGVWLAAEGALPLLSRVSCLCNPL